MHALFYERSRLFPNFTLRKELTQNHATFFYISGKPREHFLHAKACFLMKQNSPNCLLCPNENFPSKSFYLTHMKSKHGIETNVMLCVCCGVTSNLYENVARHQLKCFKPLKEEADHVCLHCDAHFYHAEPDWENPFFITHMNLKHKDKIELEWDKCPKCQLYIPPGQMESHRDKHCMWNLISNKRKEVTFISANNFASAKKPRLILPKKTDISANSLLKKLRCGLCSSTIYGDENILFQHGKICMMKKISSILCPSCPHETFDTKNAYSKHLCDHHKPRSHATKCAFCGITLPTWCDLLKHQNTCFPPLKFEAYSSCQYCDMGFFFEDIRNVFYFAHCNREHKAQIHTKWTWQCNNCGFFFPSSNYLQQHKLICVERTKPGLEQVNEAKLESIESTPDLPMPIPDEDEELDEHLESEMVFVDEVKAEPIEIEEHSEFITGDI